METMFIQEIVSEKLQEGNCCQEISIYKYKEMKINAKITMPWISIFPSISEIEYFINY